MTFKMAKKYIFCIVNILKLGFGVLLIKKFLCCDNYEKSRPLKMTLKGVSEAKHFIGSLVSSQNR